MKHFHPTMSHTIKCSCCGKEHRVHCAGRDWALEIAKGQGWLWKTSPVICIDCAGRPAAMPVPNISNNQMMEAA